MVVDDAIVIADNYVELLDEGVARAEAAWRSASDLAGPVLGATLTIVASFLPLGLLLPAPWASSSARCRSRWRWRSSARSAWRCS
jgi:hypothetical protein